MSTLQKLASAQGRRDELPNQELARALAAKKDRKGIQEIAENLRNPDKDVQSDCLKVLYEIGYLQPELIAGYGSEFLHLLSSRDNRLVWGAMIALSTMAALRPAEVYANLGQVTEAMERGSVITVDNAVKVLAQVAAASDEYNRKVFPRLLAHLRRCRPKEVAQHAESTLPAVNARNKNEFLAVLAARQEVLTPAQSARVKKIVKKLEV